MGSEPPSRRETGVYDAPDSYQELDEVEAVPPIDEDLRRPSLREAPEPEERDEVPTRGPRRRSSVYNAPESYEELNELAAISPVSDVVRRESVFEPGTGVGRDEPKKQDVEEVKISRLATQIYTHSYLVFFALLGTVARLTLTSLTRYSGTPVIFTTVWSNFAGSLVMGFLTEDRKLFRFEWGTPTYHQAIERARAKARDEEEGSGSSYVLVDLMAAKKAHLATKKTIPLYIGLATGFCGSFTTFSSFIKDVFLALANELATPDVPGSPVSRNGGYSFMAMLAVLMGTISLSVSGLFAGAHLAIGLERVMPSIPFSLNRKVLDPLAVLLGWGCWLGAVLLCVWPPHDDWRGQATFSLVFAPLGCLARFYLSLHLNGKVATFPMGTFAANVLGTAVLGMAWDLAHVPVGGMVACQVLQGVEDGFCGCLTTISTWVSELSSLRRRHAWLYGTASVVVSLAVMIAIMGGLRWSDGYSMLACETYWW